MAFYAGGVGVGGRGCAGTPSSSELFTAQFPGRRIVGALLGAHLRVIL